MAIQQVINLETLYIKNSVKQKSDYVNSNKLLGC